MYDAIIDDDDEDDVYQNQKEKDSLKDQGETLTLDGGDKSFEIDRADSENMTISQLPWAFDRGIESVTTCGTVGTTKNGKYGPMVELYDSNSEYKVIVHLYKEFNNKHDLVECLKEFKSELDSRVDDSFHDSLFDPFVTLKTIEEEAACAEEQRILTGIYDEIAKISNSIFSPELEQDSMSTTVFCTGILRKGAKDSMHIYQNNKGHKCGFIDNDKDMSFLKKWEEKYKKIHVGHR